MNDLNGIKIKCTGSSLPFVNQLKIIYDKVYTKIADELKKNA